MMTLAGVELDTLVSEPDALTTRLSKLLILKFILEDSVLFAPQSFIAQLHSFFFICACARVHLIVLF